MVQKFGEYLIGKKEIDASSLVEALHMQNKRNVMQLGETAIQSKVMSAEQLLDIMSVQDTIDERFEEVALLLGYLTQDEIDELRFKQESEQQYIGEILVAMDKISKPRLDKLLTEFNAQLDNEQLTVSN